MKAENYKFTKEHEWAFEEGGTIKVGISNYAQQELGDVVFVDLPKVGQKVELGKSFCAVESVKAVSDIYAPVSGEIVLVNESLSSSPELVNSSPLEKGWICAIKPENISEFSKLMTYTDYESYISEVSK